jgi:SpoVK/Ycf46/Vps4 family AAA+-type ATPase
MKHKKIIFLTAIILSSLFNTQISADTNNDLDCCPCCSCCNDFSECDYNPSTNEENYKTELSDEETPNQINLDDILLKKFPWSNIAETYQTPTKSKLMLQDPEMPENFKKFIYKELCPQSLKDLIIGHKRLGQKTLSNNFARHLPRVVVLHGPNGTGKSTLGVLIAKKLNYKLIFINSGFLGTMYKQSEEVNLSEEIAPLLEDGTPCVIIIDEADALVGKNDNKDNLNRNKSAAIAQMMDMIEKKPNFILVWTTNNIDQIDAKFKDRIGFCKRIEVKLPNQPQREKIIKYLITDKKETSSDNIKIACENSFNDFSYIAKITNGFSIRSLEELVAESFLKAIIRLPKKTTEDSEKNAPTNIILRKKDFIETSKKIQTGI